MKKVKVLILTLMIGGAIMSCEKKQENKVVESTDNTEVVNNEDMPEKKLVVEGNYVSDGYQQRAEGYDWVAVIVSKKTDNEIAVSVRSRADKKKPSCTFDADAKMVNDSTYQATIDENKVNFVFTDNSLTIEPNTEEDKNALFYFCSGGATLAGEYQKIDEPLDKSQLK